MQTQGGLQNAARTLNKQTAQIGITAPGNCSQMGLATATVLASRARVTDSVTLGWPLRRLKLSSSARPSTVLAS